MAKEPQLGISKVTQQAIFMPNFVEFITNSQLLDRKIRLVIHKNINVERLI